MSINVIKYKEFSDPVYRCSSRTVECRCRFGHCSCWNTSHLSSSLPSVPHNEPSFTITWIFSFLLPSWYKIRTYWAGSALIRKSLNCTVQCTCVEASVLIMILRAFIQVFLWFVARLCSIYHVVVCGVGGPACMPRGAPWFMTAQLRCWSAVCSANVIFFCFCISPPFVCVICFAFPQPCILDGNILCSRPLSTQPAWAMISVCLCMTFVLVSVRVRWCADISSRSLYGDPRDKLRR